MTITTTLREHFFLGNVKAQSVESAESLFYSNSPDRPENTEANS